MRKLLTTVALSFLLAQALGTGWAEAEETEKQFSKANRLYAEGRYQDVVDLYEAIVKSGTSSGPLYYNLGNAYFKLSRPGKAILNYERARRLMPQDEDLLANLSFVRSSLEQAQPTEELRWFEQAAFALRDLFSATGWGIALLVVWNLLFGLFLIATFAERIKRLAIRLAWCCGFAAVFSLAFAFAKIEATERTQEGIVIQKEVDVRYSPSLMGAVAFQLHEGIKAKVIRCEGQWCYIRLTRDKSGWIERGMVEII